MNAHRAVVSLLAASLLQGAALVAWAADGQGPATGNSGMTKPPGAGTAPSTKSREQVQRETEQARRSGELSTSGNTGMTKPPGADTPGSTRSRSEVKAETEEARRAGNLPATGNSGMTK